MVRGRKSDIKGAICCVVSRHVAPAGANAARGAASGDSCSSADLLPGADA